MRSIPMSGAVALLLGAALALPLSPAEATPAARALPVTNGPLLLGDHLINADGSQHQIKVPATTTMEFSPDGGRVAGVSLGNVIHIWSADGTDQVVATLPQTVRDVTWSSDGAGLAALTGDFGNTPHSIYVIPLATRVPALVYTDASTSRINLENGISWQPGGTKILFTLNLPPGAANITQQLFTVPSAGGAPTQFFVPPEAPGDPVYRFGTPEWAPDGTRIAVWVQENGAVPAPYQHTYISVMTTGVAPVQLRAVHVTHPAAAGPYWSTDGSALLFSDVPAGPGPAPATVIAAAGAAPLGTYAYGGQITDWQPCPTGTCVVWGAAHGAHPVAPGLQEEGDQGPQGDVHRRRCRRGCVGLHGGSDGRPAEGGDGSARPVPSPGRGHDRRGRSVQAEGQGPQHRPLPGRGHRATGLPDRDVPRGQGQSEAPQATQIGVRSPTVAG